MLENYIIDGLIIGKLVTVSNYGWSHGPNLTYEGPYIFYHTKENKYYEVFTETEYSYHKPSSATTRKNYKVSDNVEANEFGKTYIEPTESILDYLTDTEKENFSKNPKATLSKKRIVEIYKNMIIKDNEREKQIKETETQYTLNNSKKYHQ